MSNPIACPECDSVDIWTVYEDGMGESGNGIGEFIHCQVCGHKELVREYEMGSPEDEEGPGWFLGYEEEEGEDD